MVYAYKDYGDIPPVLQSEQVQQLIDRILRSQTLGGTPQLEWIMHKDVLEKLVEVHRSKCAYCEQKISIVDSSVFLTYYRPYSQYYWLAYEWSNMLPVCKACYLYTEHDFPVENEHLHRVKTPPESRQDWLPTGIPFLKEKPLLLNPEMDKPEKYLIFNPDGYIEAIEQNSRAINTIEAYQLNKGQVVVARKKKIELLFTRFEKAITTFKRFDADNSPNQKAMDEYFIPIFNDLVEMSKPEAEFSLLGRSMLYQFNTFFSDKLYKPKDRKILRNAYHIYMKSTFPSWEAPVKSVKKEEEEVKKKIILEGISIDNVKCFNQIAINFPSLKQQGNSVLITGTNGNGKSTILQLLALGLTGLHRPPVAYGWTDVIKSKEEEAGFSILLDAYGDAYSFDFDIDLHDRISCNTHHDYYNALLSKIFILGYGTGRKRYATKGSQYRSFEPIASLFGDNSFLKTMNDERTSNYVTEQFTQIKVIINQILKGADDHSSIQLSGYVGKVFYFETPTGKASVYSMSDGFQTIFAWIFDMLIRLIEAAYNIEKLHEIYGVVLIDELDMHLNLSWQRNFLPVLESLFPNIQFIVTTQSPFTVQSVKHNHITMLSLEGNQVIAQPLIHEGKAWAWTTHEIMLRMINHDMDISNVMQAKLKEIQNAFQVKEMKTFKKLTKELNEALPQDSPYRNYLNSLVSPSHTDKSPMFDA
jgi:uncharacterized protein (TIGR02646 family)